jgi:hypothetical protein
MFYIEARVLRVGLQKMVALNMKDSFKLAVQEHTNNNCLKLLSLIIEM